MRHNRITCWTAAVWRSFCAFAVALSLASGARAQIPCRYEVSHIIQAPFCQGPGAHYPPTIGTAISPSGRYVCGYYYSCGFTSYFAFLYDTKTTQFMTLPFAASNLTRANDVNDQYVVGQGGNASGSFGFLFEIATGQVTILNGAIAGGGAEITGINSSNVVCGTRTIGGAPNYPRTAFIWSAQNGFTDLGLINGQSTSAADINDTNVVTGWMLVNNLQHPFLWDGSTLTDVGTLTGIGNGTIPFALSDSGYVVGQGAVPYSGSLPFVQHPFLYARATLHELPILPNHVSGTANDVNNAGLAGGFCRNASEQDTAVLWYQGAIFRIGDLLTEGSPLIVNGELNALNDSGLLVVGSAINGSLGTMVLAPRPKSTADITNDCRVNVADLLLVINEWHQPNSTADINKDGTVDLDDLMLVVENWTGI